MVGNNKNETILGKTRGFCDVCDNLVPAEVINKNGQVFIRKKCPEHGLNEYLHVWDDPDTYLAFARMNFWKGAVSDKVVINLTNKCNMNCPTCFASANELKQDDFDLSNVDKLKNYKYIYLSGGEPTIKDDLFDYISKIKKGGHELIIFSNGIKLSDKKFAEKIKKSGVDLIVLQFDSPDDNDNRAIRGMDVLDFKKKALKNLEDLGIPVFINAVIRKDNLSKIKELFNLVTNYNNVKIIGVNPVWQIGRFDENNFVPTSGIMNEIESSMGISKESFYLSHAFLLNLEYVYHYFRHGKRFFSKCIVGGFVMKYKDKLIPLAEILDLKKINNRIEKIAGNKNKSFKFVFFIITLLLFEFPKTFFINKYFRYFLWSLVKNIKFLFKKDFLSFNPMHLLSIITFPDKKNLDMNFISTCNFHALSYNSDKIVPACLFRVDLNENK